MGSAWRVIAGEGTGILHLLLAFIAFFLLPALAQAQTYGFHRTYVPTALSATVLVMHPVSPKGAPPRLSIAYWTDIAVANGNKTSAQKPCSAPVFI